MKTDDVILKWMQRIWIFVITPIIIFVSYIDILYKGGGERGGVLAWFAYPLTKLAAWPLGTLFMLVFGELMRVLPELSRIGGYLIILLPQPIMGMFQWFFLVPCLFKKWDMEARQRFWVVWFLSIPVALLIWLVLWLSS